MATKTTTTPAEDVARELGLPPIDQATLKALALLGRVTDQDGRATGKLRQAMIPLHGAYDPGSLNAACRRLTQAGLITRQIDGRRTYLIDLTMKGAGVAAQLGATRVDLLAEPDEPDPSDSTVHAPEPDEPEPAEDDERAVTTDLGSQSEPEPEENGAALTVADMPHVTNGHVPDVADVSPNAIASALLAQTVRVLSDTNLSTLTAERDAYRAHNESLITRLDQVTAERDRAVGDAREIRQFLHRLETAITPVLNAQSLIDARTRTELLNLMNEVIR